MNSPLNLSNGQGLLKQVYKKEIASQTNDSAPMIEAIKRKNKGC